MIKLGLNVEIVLIADDVSDKSLLITGCLKLSS